MSQKIADRARELVMPLAQSMGLEVVEVEFVRENAEWSLRVYIDKRGGVRIDDCEQLSKVFSTVLDDEDIINRAYSLVVSSPGLDRPLKTEADFRRYEDELLDVRMLPGRLKTSYKEELPAEQGEKPLAPGKKARSGHGANRADTVSGILVKFDEGRIYLKDARGGTFSLAWEDVKTAKRAIRFK